jgi:hypothetical protein
MRAGTVKETAHVLSIEEIGVHWASPIVAIGPVHMATDELTPCPRILCIFDFD